MTRVPATKACQLDCLDDAEVIEGYNDGRRNEPEPGDNRSYSYWHGWRNGMVDGGHAEPDRFQQALAKDVVQTKYFSFKPHTTGGTR